MLKSMSLGLKLRLAFGLIVMTALLTGAISNFYARLVITLIAYISVAYPVLIAAAKDLVIRHRMSEQFLMTIATFGALGLQDFPEALAVMIFYLIGDAFEDYAAARSHNEIAALVKLKPSQVRVIDDEGVEHVVKPRQVKIGSKIRVLAGEAVALDGTLVNASAAIDLSALNGESEPALFEQGQEVPSGGINLGQVIELIVTKDNKNSSITRLINLIEDSAANKSRPEALITRFSVYYTPIVVACAVLLSLVPLVMPNEEFANWFTRGLIFLVVSCPCALVLSVPLSFFGGLGAISKTGVMVKGSIHLENLAKLKALAFDKTGTITQGKFTVINVQHMDAQGKVIQALTPEKLLQDKSQYVELMTQLSWLCALERYTTHPIGQAIVNFCNEHNFEQIEAAEIKETPGFGLEGKINGHTIAVGQLKWVQQRLHITPEPSEIVGTEVYIMQDDQLLSRVILADQVKSTALPMFDALRRLGIKTYMITGDKEKTAAAVAKQCHIDTYYAEQLPQDKLSVLNKIKQQQGITAFAGDGINDAPSLAASDAGIAMGQFGSAAAVEAADIVVMNDDLTKIPKTIELARRTYDLAKQNMIFVISVKLLILILGALGFANIWLAILGDVGLCVLAVLNAMRTLSWVKTPKSVAASQITSSTASA